MLVVGFVLRQKHRKPIVFSAKGNVLVFPGWKAFVANDEMSEPDDDNSDDDTEGALPPLNNGEDLPCQKAQVLDKKTKPPANRTMKRSQCEMREADMKGATPNWGKARSMRRSRCEMRGAGGKGL